MANAAYQRNDLDRCFWCKDALMDAVEPIVAVAGATVALGVNLDELDDPPPGQEAARARGAVFPAVEARITTHEGRAVYHTPRLRTWDKTGATVQTARTTRRVRGG